NTAASVRTVNPSENKPKARDVKNPDITSSRASSTTPANPERRAIAKMNPHVPELKQQAPIVATPQSEKVMPSSSNIPDAQPPAPPPESKPREDSNAAINVKTVDADVNNSIPKINPPRPHLPAQTNNSIPREESRTLAAVAQVEPILNTT